MKRDTCPICDTASIAQLDYLQDVPALLNRMARTVTEARAAPRGTLDIVGCNGCGFVWNRSFDPGIVAYDPTYENDQSHSPAFRSHMEGMAANVLASVDADGVSEIVEVGCGQAVFLRALIAGAGPRLRRASGFDPVFRNQPSVAETRIRVFEEYFDERTVTLLEVPPSLVVTRHTIEHVASPVAFLKTIRRAIGETPARLFIETPDVRWILARGATEDWFYEHCSLFDQHSLTLALKTAGFLPIRVDRVFQAQYLWAQATINRPADREMPAPSRITSFPNLSDMRRRFVDQWQQRVNGAGPVVVWGAGAKGVTFCTLVDSDATRVAAVVDINPAKHNMFVPASGHHVVSPADLVAIRPRMVIVMNANYRDEVAMRLSELGVNTSLVTLESEDSTSAA